MKTGRLVTVSLTVKWIALLRSGKELKASPGYSICHQCFNLNFMKRWQYYLYAKKKKKLTSLSLFIPVAPFWILPIERMQRTLFCIRLNARMCYFHSNQSVNICRIRILVWTRLAERSHIGQRTIQTITSQCAERHNFPTNGSTGWHQWQRKQNNTKTIQDRHHVWPLIMMEQVEMGRISTQWQEGKESPFLSGHGSALHFTARYSLFCTFPHSELTARPKHTQRCGSIEESETLFETGSRECVILGVIDLWLHFRKVWSTV